MATTKEAMPTTQENDVVYQIVAPVQEYWDDTQKRMVKHPPYTSKDPIFGVRIIGGKGETRNRNIAIEFADMGYTVTPNPKIETVRME
jgi:hypothetical protein